MNSKPNTPSACLWGANSSASQSSRLRSFPTTDKLRPLVSVTPITSGVRLRLSLDYYAALR